MHCCSMANDSKRDVNEGPEHCMQLLIDAVEQRKESNELLRVGLN